MLVLRAVYNVSFRVKSYSFCISVFWNADIALSLSIVLRQLCYMLNPIYYAVLFRI